VACAPLIWGSATLLRAWALPPAAILVAVSLLALGAALLLVIRAPTVFLGPDGQWMLETMRNFVGKLRRPAPIAQAPAAVPVPASE
jgi:hypothetical protein